MTRRKDQPVMRLVADKVQIVCDHCGAAILTSDYWDAYHWRTAHVCPDKDDEFPGGVGTSGLDTVATGADSATTADPTGNYALRAGSAND